MDEVVIQGLYRKKYRQVTNPDTFNDFIKDAYMVEEDSFAANQGWSAELRFVTYYVGQHGLMTRFLRNIQHMTNPCGVSAEAAKRGFFPGTLVISAADCLWADSEVERDAMEEMGTYPCAANDGRFLAKHANLRGANRSKGNGDVTTYCMAGDLPYVEELQPLILARLEGAGPRECEHASCSRAPWYGSADDRQKRWCQEHGRVDSVCLHTQLCEDCGVKSASFGMADKKRRWCGDCKLGHPGCLHSHGLCEDCGVKDASFGMADGKRRWCAGCKHEGAAITRRVCEDCGRERARWGPPGAKTKQWCGTCAKQHPGAERADPKCEDCRLTFPSWGMSDSKRRRWCATCARANHQGAVARYKPREKRKKKAEQEAKKRQRR